MSDNKDTSRPESRHSGRQSRGENLRQTDFFKVADETLLLSRGRGREKVESPEEILFLDLSQQQLVDISQLSLCLNLKICVLHSNFVSNIEPLSSAANLHLMDLSSNRIKQIPDKKFWAGFPYLEILYLHDNPISSLECFDMLSAASKLRVVTLYDTPLSLNNTYRHIAVNSLWHLEGMDFYLLSDEEVIQDMDLYDTPFAAMSDPYFLQLYQPLNPNWDFLTAENHASQFLYLINRKLAKLSPVLMVQRYIRGWLVRKKIPIEIVSKLSTIRKKLDKWFQPVSSSKIPIFRDSSYWLMLKSLQAPPPTAENTFLAPLLEQTTIDFAKLATSINRKLHSQSIRKYSHASRAERSYSTISSQSFETDLVAKRYTRSYGMFLHLQKMKRNSWKLLNSAPPTFGHLYRTSRIHKRKLLRKLTQGSLNRSTLSLSSEPESEDLTHIMFRDQSLLVSKQEPIKPLDVYKEMLFSKRDTGLEIRYASEKIHEIQRFYSKSNIPKINKTSTTKNDIPSSLPMNIRQLEGIMKRAAENKKRRNELEGKSSNIREQKEEAMLRKLGAEMVRDRSRDRLSRMGRSVFEETREKMERLKFEEMELNRQRVKEFREKERQAKDKQFKLIEASLNSSNTKEARLLLSDKANSKSSKDFIKRRLKVEKMKEGEKQAIQKVLQKSIDKTRRIQASRLVEREQMNEELSKADKTRQIYNKRRIKEVKSPSENESFWTREGITPSYYLPKAGSISPIFGRTSVQHKSAAQINLKTNDN